MYKPIYHYFPGKNWMNDPNGVCWYGGKYHLFYQYNPQSDQWGNLHWGHAVSDDSIHWKHCPEALFPSTELGETHCFSGCASTDGKLPILYYTSVGEEKDGRDSRYGAQQWCAISEDGMYTWEKYEGNPILTKEIHGDLPVLEWHGGHGRRYFPGILLKFPASFPGLRLDFSAIFVYTVRQG